jgi:hypothetical protein
MLPVHETEVIPEGETCHQTSQKKTSERVLSYDYVWCKVASAPSPLCEGGATMLRRCFCSAARLPPNERPLGFAPPLRSGFAFIATPQRQRI